MKNGLMDFNGIKRSSLVEIFIWFVVLCSKEEYRNGVKISSVVVYLHYCQPHTVFLEFLSHDLICDKFQSCRSSVSTGVWQFGYGFM